MKKGAYLRSTFIKVWIMCCSIHLSILKTTAIISLRVLQLFRLC